MTVKSFFFYLYKVSILLLILKSMHAWFLWSMPDAYFSLVISLFSLFFLIICNIKLRFSSFQFIGLFFLSLAAIFKSDLSLGGIIGNLSWLFPVSILIFIEKSKLADIWSFIKKAFYYLLIPSLILHVFLLFYHIPSPFIISNPASPYYIFSNYFILVKNFILYSDRFCSIFLEPGYLGTFLAFYLYVEKFDFSKKENKLVLLAFFFSFSLAGYILGVIGYCFYLISTKPLKISLVKVFVSFSVLFVFYVGVRGYNDGHNLLNELIIDRLDVDKDKGIKGNNRVTENVDIYFDYAVKTGKIWFGLGSEYVSLKTGEDRVIGAGYKDYLLYFGLFDAILFGIGYFFMALGGSRRLFSLSFFLIIFLCFLQASYPLSSSWLVPFFTALRSGGYRRRLAISKT